MRKWLWGALVGVGCMALVGCAPRYAAVTPSEADALLRTGQPLLSCREPCLADWQRAAPQAAQLDAGGRWRELAVLVLHVGYEDDLSVYYLGRAAEGIGYPGAAASYYRQSMQLSGTAISCRSLSHWCGTVILPRAAALRLAAIDRALSRPRYRRTRPAPPRSGASANEIEGSAPVSAVPVPLAPVPEAPVPEAPVSAAPVTPAPGPAVLPPSDYIEPPPVVH